MADRYWVGGSGTWDTTGTANWSATSGGSGGASVPTTADRVFFDQPGPYTVTMSGGGLTCLDITVSGASVTFATGTTPSLNVAGSWSTVGTTVWNSTGTVIFSSTAPRTITTNGITIDASFTFAGSGGTWTLQDNLTLNTTRTTTLNNGTLALGSFTLTTGLFASSGSTARTLNFGTGKIVLNSATTSTIWNTGTVTSLTVSGTPLVECIGGGTAVTKTINTGALSLANSISFSLLETTGSVTYTFTASNVVRNLLINGSQRVTNIAITIYGNYTYLDTNGVTNFLQGANAWTFGATSGTQNITSSPSNTFGASTYFDGAGDFLTVADNDALDFGTGDFTIECFVNFSALTSSRILVEKWASTAGGGWSLYWRSTGTSLAFSSGNAGGVGTVILQDGNATRVAAGGWYHVAVAREGSTIRMFVNGTLVSSATDSTDYTSTFNVGIGRQISTSTNDFYGYLSNVRLVKGTAVYTANFSPPTSNLTNISGTSLLTCQSSTTITDASSNAFTITVGGNTGPSTLMVNEPLYDFPITINSVGATTQLSSSITVGPTRTVTLTAGTFAFNTNTLTTGIFVSSGTGVRTLNFGTGKMSMVSTATATIWNTSTVTSMTVSGTPLVECRGGGAGVTKTLSAGALSAANSISFSFIETMGTVTYSFGSGNTFRNILVNGQQSFNNIAITLYGTFTHLTTNGTTTFTAGSNAWTLAAPSGVQTLGFLEGFTYDFPWNFGAAGSTASYTLPYNITLGATRRVGLYGSITFDFNSKAITCAYMDIFGAVTIANTGSSSLTLAHALWVQVGGTLSLPFDITVTSTVGGAVTSNGGTINLNSYTLTTHNFNGSTSTARTINFGTGKIVCNRNTAGISWDCSTSAALTLSGTKTVEFTGGGTGVTKTIRHNSTGSAAASPNFNIIETTGTVTYSFDAAVATQSVENLTINGAQTFAATAVTLNIYGNYVYSNTNGETTFTGTTGTWVFASTSGTKTITTGDKALGWAWTINGAGGIFQVQDSISFANTSNITVTAGTFDLNSKPLSGNNFILNGGTFISTGNASLSTVANIVQATGNYTMQFPVTTTGNGGYTLTAGNFLMNNFALTTPVFISNNSGVRSINFANTGQINITGSNTTIWNMATGTNFTASGNIFINCTYTGSEGIRFFNISIGEVVSNSGFNFSTSGNRGIVVDPSSTDTFRLAGGIGNVDLTGYNGIWQPNASLTIYGNLLIPAVGGTMGPYPGTGTYIFGSTSPGNVRTINTNGRELAVDMWINSTANTIFRLDSNLQLANTRSLSLVAGNFNLNGYVANVGGLTIAGGSSNRVANFTVAGSEIDLSGSGMNVVNVVSAANFTWSGTPNIVSTYSGSTGNRTFAFGNMVSPWIFDVHCGNITSGNHVNLGNTATDGIIVSGNVRNIDLTGLTANYTQGTGTVTGNIYFPPTGGNFNGTANNTLTLVGGSPNPQTIDLNDRTCSFGLLYNPGAAANVLRLLSNANIGTNTICNVNYGNFELNDFTLKCGMLWSNTSNTAANRTINFANSGIIQVQYNGDITANTTVDFAQAANLLLTGNIYIYCSNAGSSTMGLKLGSTSNRRASGNYMFDIYTNNTMPASGSRGIVTNSQSSAWISPNGNSTINNINLASSLTRFVPGDFTNGAVFIAGNVDLTCNVGSGSTSQRLNFEVAPGTTRTYRGDPNNNWNIANMTLQGNNQVAAGNFDFQTTINTAAITTMTGGNLLLNNNKFRTSQFSIQASATLKTIDFGGATGNGIVEVYQGFSTTSTYQTILNLGSNVTYVGTPTFWSSTQTTGGSTLTNNRIGIYNTGSNNSQILDFILITDNTPISNAISVGIQSNSTLRLSGEMRDFIGSNNNASAGYNQMFSWSSSPTIYGNLTMPSSGLSVVNSENGGTWTFAGSGNKTISNIGTMIGSGGITFNGVGGVWTLSGSTVNPAASGGNLNLANGSVRLTAGVYANHVNIQTGTKSFIFNGGNLQVGNQINVQNGTNFTSSTESGNSLILWPITNTANVAFTGNNTSWSAWLRPSTGISNCSILGNNTFKGISYPFSGFNFSATRINFGAGTTTTFTDGVQIAAANNTVASGLVLTTQSGRATLNYSGANYRAVNVNYANISNISFTPFVTNGTTPIVWYLGANSTNPTGSVTGGIYANNNANAALVPTVYVIETGTSWTVPSDWNNSNNIVHLYGAGGGGGGGRITSATNKAAGAGGGGGGYTAVTNFATSAGAGIAYEIGLGGTGGAANADGTNGGNTTWSSGTYIAGGGFGGATTNVPTSLSGAGGIGANSNGGNGGGGAITTVSGTGLGGGGGGGSGGPLGKGGNGGFGFGSTTAANTAGGGGGGSGNGTAGGNATVTAAGTGGNNSAGVGGGAAGTSGTRGGGGGGGRNTATPGKGGAGVDIFGGVGGGGGGGATANLATPNNDTTYNYGGGGAGGGVTTATTGFAGGAGANGVIIVAYYSCTSPVFGSTSTMFLVF